MKRIETALVDTQWTDTGADMLISAKVTAVCSDETVSPGDWQVSAGFVDNPLAELETMHETVQIAEGETRTLRIIARVATTDPHPFSLKRRDDGKVIDVPLLRLNADDQQYVMDKTGWGRVWEDNSGGFRVVAELKEDGWRAIVEAERCGSQVCRVAPKSGRDGGGANTVDRESRLSN